MEKREFVNRKRRPWAGVVLTLLHRIHHRRANTTGRGAGVDNDGRGNLSLLVLPSGRERGQTKRRGSGKTEKSTL